jgi:hypothetical protein
MTGDISKGTLGAKDNMSELETMLVSILATIQESKERYETSHKELENKLETSHKELENKLEISYKKLENKLEASDVESKERHEALQN